MTATFDTFLENSMLIYYIYIYIDLYTVIIDIRWMKMLSHLKCYQIQVKLGPEHVYVPY